MDYGATNDPVTSTSDVYVLPEYLDEGIYLLDEASMKDDPLLRRNTLERDLSDVRMRGGLAGKVTRQHLPPGYPPTAHYASGERYASKEGFMGRADRYRPTGTQTFRQYEQQMPTQTLLRSSRRGRIPMQDAGWDNRPPGFRPDDGPRDSAFIPPPDVRPPRGGIITPWEISYAPTYSEAIMKASVADPNMVGLAPCGAVPTAAHLGGRESFGSNPGCSANFFAMGMQMGKMNECLKMMLVLIIVVLLAIWLVMSAAEKKLGRHIKEAIREAVEAIKSR